MADTYVYRSNVTATCPLAMHAVQEVVHVIIPAMAGRQLRVRELLIYGHFKARLKN